MVLLLVFGEQYQPVFMSLKHLMSCNSAFYFVKASLGNN